MDNGGVEPGGGLGAHGRARSSCPGLVESEMNGQAEAFLGVLLEAAVARLGFNRFRGRGLAAVAVRWKQKLARVGEAGRIPRERPSARPSRRRPPVG